MGAKKNSRYKVDGYGRNMILSDSQLDALHELEKAPMMVATVGATTPKYLNTRTASSLVDHGLAIRTGPGWKVAITERGSEMLAASRRAR